MRTAAAAAVEQSPRPACPTPFEVWVDARWSSLTRGAPYVEYERVVPSACRAEAERIAREHEGALVYERDTGEVYAPLQ